MSETSDQGSVAIILVTGARTSEYISKQLTESSGRQLAIQSVDECIRELYKEENNLAKEVAIKQIAYDHSVDYIVRLWERGARRAIDALSLRTEPNKALMMYPVWYGDRRHERYSPVSLTVLQEYLTSKGFSDGIGKVLFLLDDIYDMAWRHSMPGEYWDSSTAMNEFVDTLDSDFHGQIKDALGVPYGDHARLQALALSFRIHCLNAMLEWRRQELLLGRNIASTLKAKAFLPFSVKQLSSVASSFLTTSKPSVYLSHPISEPRRHLKRHRKWPDLVLQLNRLPARFLHQDALLIMPTGIDELRIVRHSEGLLPELGERWPVPEGDLLYTKDYPGGKSCDSVDHPRALSPKDPIQKVASKYGFSGAAIDAYELEYSEVRKTSSAQLFNFVKDVEEQIGERDNALVLNTDGIFVYRPLFGDGKTRFSAGVRAELEYWHLLRGEEELGYSSRGFPRRCILFHSVSDIQKWLLQSKGLVVERVVKEVQEVIKEQHHLSGRQAEALVDKNITVVSKSELSALSLSSIRADANKIFMGCTERILRSLLCGDLEVIDGKKVSDRIARKMDPNMVMLIRTSEGEISNSDLASMSLYFREGKRPKDNGKFRSFVEELIEESKKQMTVLFQ